MSFYLTDDGTMDTVVRCAECGREERFNYDGDSLSDSAFENELRDWLQEGYGRSVPTASDRTAFERHLYDVFVESCIDDATADHECESGS